MNKEEAKKLLHDQGEQSLWGVDAVNYRNFMNDLDAAIDGIELEHKPALLPPKVGKQWIELVRISLATNQTGSRVDHAVVNLNNLGSLDLEYSDLVNWFNNTPDAYAILIDAARYGWTPEPDKKYLVYVPLTDQTFIYRHVAVYLNSKPYLGVVEYDEESKDPAELFTDKQIRDFKLGEYEREEVPE